MIEWRFANFVGLSICFFVTSLLNLTMIAGTWWISHLVRLSVSLVLLSDCLFVWPAIVMIEGEDWTLHLVYLVCLCFFLSLFVCLFIRYLTMIEGAHWILHLVQSSGGLLILFGLFTYLFFCLLNLTMMDRTCWILHHVWLSGAIRQATDLEQTRREPLSSN